MKEIMARGGHLKSSSSPGDARFLAWPNGCHLFFSMGNVFLDQERALSGDFRKAMLRREDLVNDASVGHPAVQALTQPPDGFVRLRFDALSHLIPQFHNFFCHLV